MTKEELLKELEGYRLQKNMTNREFAEAAGVLESCWSRIRRGKRKLPTNSILLTGIIQNIPVLRKAVIKYMKEKE